VVQGESEVDSAVSSTKEFTLCLKEEYQYPSKGNVGNTGAFDGEKYAHIQGPGKPEDLG
jgi:hypothetical protein